MGSTGRVLVLMRHAKAEAFAAADHERALTDRGRGDAVESGLWLAAAGVEPDHVLVSSAVRTSQTWDALAHGLRGAPEVVLMDALYSASPETMLDLVREVPLDAGTVIVVGHNPTVAYLAHMLDDGNGDRDAFLAMSQGYPTAALTILDVGVAWHELDAETCSVSGFHVGHGSTVG